MTGARAAVCVVDESVTRTIVTLRIAAAAAVAAIVAAHRKRRRRRAAGHQCEGRRTEAGGRLDLGREHRETVGDVGELGHERLAPGAAVGVQQHLGALTAAQRAQGQIRRELAHLCTTEHAAHDTTAPIFPSRPQFGSRFGC